MLYRQTDIAQHSPLKSTNLYTLQGDGAMLPQTLRLLCVSLAIK